MDEENTFGKVLMPSFELSENEHSNYFTVIIVFLIEKKWTAEFVFV